MIKAVSQSLDGTDAVSRVINDILGENDVESDTYDTDVHGDDQFIDGIDDRASCLGHVEEEDNPGDSNEGAMPEPQETIDIENNTSLPFKTLQASELSPIESDMLTHFTSVERFDTPESLEEICSAGTNGTKLHDFYVALAVYCVAHPLTENAYSALVELLQLVDDVSLLQNMPLSQKTARSWLDSRMPMPRIFRKEVKLDKRKVGQKDGTIDRNSKHFIYLFDDREKIRSFLFDDDLRKDMHFGMGYRSMAVKNL